MQVDGSVKLVISNSNPHDQFIVELRAIPEEQRSPSEYDEIVPFTTANVPIFLFVP